MFAGRRMPVRMVYRLARTNTGKTPGVCRRTGQRQLLADINAIGITNVIAPGQRMIINAETLADTVQGITGAHDINGCPMMGIFDLVRYFRPVAGS